jgi:hypothetical protein
VSANDKAPIVITGRIVLPDTRKRKPSADASTFFAKVGQPQLAET